MEVDDLAAFLLLTEELHFGRAARRLNISGPSLSRTIRDLERAIGVRLLVRTTRNVSLTVAGKVLASGVPRVLDTLEDLIEDVQSTT